MLADIRALHFRCPRCGQGYGQHCRTPSGAVPPVHAARRSLAVALVDSLDEWNRANPIGTRVRAYPGVRPDDAAADLLGYTVVVGRTRTAAWIPDGHTAAVVMVTGHSAWIALSHIDTVNEGD